MNKSLPDKWVRKAVYDAINNVVVDTKTIPCYDTRVTGRTQPKHYVLLTTQSNTVDKANKCESRWESSILIDIVTRYNGSGNTGSRLLADNILDEVRNLTKSLVLNVESGLTIINQTQSFPNDISTQLPNQNIFRKLMRIELVIN